MMIYSAIVQVYDIPLQPILTRRQSSSAVSKPPPQPLLTIATIKPKEKPKYDVTARLRSAFRVDGKLNLVAFAKNVEPHPAMALLYYKVNEQSDEQVTYHVKILDIPGAEGALLEGYKGSEDCLEESG
jgi:hypothetical protein